MWNCRRPAGGLRLSHLPRLLFAVSVLLTVEWQASGQIAPDTTTSLFATGGITRPESGVVLAGTAINPSTGTPYRHLWYGDAINGVCRVDPDVDTPGPHVVNGGTCLHLVFGVQLQPGQLAFDPVTNDLYAVDMAAATQGIFRLHFLPGGDSGQGLMDLLHQEVVGGAGSTRQGAIASCGIPANIPNSAVMGPDGNLYIGFKKSGKIMRVLAPHTEPLPCSNVQIIGSTPDRQRDFGLGWIGHDLYGADSQAAWVMYGADSCKTAANNNALCSSIHFLVNTLPLATQMVSDQVYPALNGHMLYYAAPGNVSKLQILPSVQLTVDWALGLDGVNGLAIDPANQVLYVGDDPTVLIPGARTANQGNWYVTTVPTGATAIPGAPTNVSAVAGNSQASVAWVQAQDGQPVTDYVVHVLAADGSTVPDVTVSAANGMAPPTSDTFTGLTNGIAYQFEVMASNTIGSSPWSTPSAAVVPIAPVAPAAPTSVSATAGNSSATITWIAPVANGGSPLISYTVTTLAGGQVVASSVVPATSTSTVISGLASGTTYTFTVHATNSAGSSPESAASNPVVPSTATADMAVTISGPASVSSGSVGSYTVTATNLGTGTAPGVTLITDLPATGATLVPNSFSSSQGSCSLTGTGVNCALGNMNPGGTATFTVALTISARIVLTAAVGSAVTDPNPLNNNTSVATSIVTPPTTATTDIQVTGSAQNGGPPVGSTEFYTWQIKNAKNQVAPTVAFTDSLPTALSFVSATADVGSCSSSASGGVVSCSAASLGVGQTMTVTVSATVLQTGTIANTASATFAGTDTNPANNSFTVSIKAK